MKQNCCRIVLMLYLLLNNFPIASNGQSFFSDAENLPLLERTRYLIGARPREALQLLDSLEKAAEWPVYKACTYRMLAYDKLSMKHNAFLQGQKALHSKGLLSDTLALRAAYITVASLALDLDRMDYATAYISQGLDLARKIQSLYMEAGLLSIKSELCYRQALYNEAFQLSKEAFNMLSANQGESEHYLLSVLYGRNIRFSIARKDYANAITLALERETLLKKMEKEAKLFYFILDRQKSENYSLLAFCFIQEHNKERAEYYYNLYKHTDYAGTVLGRTLINDYLLSVQQYMDVLDNNYSLYKEVYQLDDTVNLNYAKLLQQTALACSGIGNYRNAYIFEKRSREVLDSLHRREGASIEKLLNCNFSDSGSEPLHTNKALNRNIVYTTLVMLIILVVVLFILYIRKKRPILDSKVFSEDLQDTCSEMEKAGSTACSGILSSSESLSESSSQQEKATSSSTSQVIHEETVHTNSGAYWGLFKPFDEEVRRQKLYLDYQLGRDEYMKLMKVDKNRFGGILKECAGTNLNGYLNSLRLEHAIHLMKEHPELTIAEIATQCAIPGTSTFFRLFKEKYGMSPNEFRQNFNKDGK